MDSTLLTNLYNLLFHGFSRYFNSQKEKLIINQPVEEGNFFSDEEENYNSKMECPLNGKSSQHQSEQTSFYTSGVSLSLTIFFGYLLYKLVLVLAHYAIRSYLTVSVHVIGGSINSQGDKSYHMILGWFGDNLKTFPHFTINQKVRESCCNKKETKEIYSLPSFGTHFFQYKGSWLILKRVQTPEVSNYDVSYEALTLTTWKWNKGILTELLIDAKKNEKNDDEDKTAFHYISCGDWSLFGEPKKRRQFDSVIMSSGVKENLRADIVEFLESEDWYSQRGIPHRRGYLLYGPPGCGKSSFIKAIAGEIGFDICMLSLSHKDLTDDDLNQLMNSAPEKSMILLEDIDAAFKSRDSECSTSKETSLAFEGAGASKVTFRGLLNALDGVASTDEGRIIFLTTNYIDRLDPALVRPGRVDVKVLVDLPDEDQLKQMFRKFYPETNEEQMVQFAKVIKDLNKELSMAMVQGLFMMNKNSAHAAIENAEKYFTDQQYFPVKKEIEKEAVTGADETNGEKESVSDSGEKSDEKLSVSDSGEKREEKESAKGTTEKESQG